MNRDRLAEFLDADRPVIRVRLTGVRGSSPREAGAEMFVAESDMLGTIGGGQLEHIAVGAARKLLVAGDLATELDVPLGPEIGQCCGGRVSVALTRMSNADRKSALVRAGAESAGRPHVYIMGGGHVGRALADLFQHLPFRTIVVDQREEELDRCHADVEKRVNAIPEIDIMTAPGGSAFIVLTHDHGLDFLLASTALERGDTAYVGLIGSATKRAKFAAWLRKHSASTGVDALVCPIGQSESRDKRPEIIAAHVVAEVVSALASARKQPVHRTTVQQTTAGKREDLRSRNHGIQRGERGQ